jgi:hypothetical protein
MAQVDSGAGASIGATLTQLSTPFVATHWYPLAHTGPLPHFAHAGAS